MCRCVIPGKERGTVKKWFGCALVTAICILLVGCTRPAFEGEVTKIYWNDDNEIVAFTLRSSKGKSRHFFLAEDAGFYIDSDSVSEEDFWQRFQLGTNVFVVYTSQKKTVTTSNGKKVRAHESDHINIILYEMPIQKNKM